MPSQPSPDDNAPANALPPDDTLSFSRFLQRRLDVAPPPSKGERTRLRLKIAAISVLEEKGYHATRVIDITSAAGVAEGLFYVYFKDKPAIAVEVLEELLEDFFDAQIVRGGEPSAFKSIRNANMRWLSVTQANAGLMRCILQVGDEVPALARLAQSTNKMWYERAARSTVRRHRGGLAEQEAMLLAYMLGAMMDELVRKAFIYPDPEFMRLLDELKVDLEGLCDVTSVLWFRVLYPNEPIAEDLLGVAARIAAWLR